MTTTFRNLGLAALAAGLLLTGCGPDYPKCDKDAHCHEGEYCVNNICQQCRDNGDCPEGQECNAGACREIPGYCSQSADCADGQVCREGTCGPCLGEGDCPEGSVCIDGTCGTAECHTTEDCPAGLSCVGYRCQVDTGSQSALGPGDCQLEPIYFAFDSSEITEEMRRVLENNYDCLLKRGGKVTLEGHCDPLGTTEYNMALGERRAQTTRKLFTALGIERSDVKVVSKGEEEATGTNESGWAKDRRVDFE
ncbi:MAG: OmpA family protein [Deltaproteobacteria bacterium]|jgi:peptidoglycan-associated lipoprotein|nr:OmpA family protein [Deltaproteobacteria bacterium]